MKFENLVHLYIENKSNDVSIALQAIDLMKKYGESDDLIKYKGLYYEAHYLYIHGSIEKSFALVINVITHLSYYDYCVELGKCYLLMGSIYMNRGDKMQGVDCFLNAKELAEKHSDMDISSGVYSCLGAIYDQFHDYNKAIHYFEKAFYISNSFCMQRNGFLLEATNLALVHCRANDFEKAKAFYNLSLTYHNASALEPYFINLFVIRCLIAKHDNDEEELKNSINEIIKWMKDDLIDINGLQEIIRVFPHLLNINTVDLIEKLLVLLHHKAEFFDIIDVRIAVISAKILYYKLVDKQMSVCKTMIRFHELSTQKDYENKQAFLEGINVKIELQRVIKLQEETERDSNVYKEKAQKDELTGLYNRSMLKGVYEKLFADAKCKHKNIGLIIFDMDSFKQYNDYFGHIAGDKCIRDITGVMHRLCDDRIKFLRYGGDEFLGLFYDYSEIEIKSYSKLIQAEVRALNIDHPKSASNEKIASITQGGFIGIPENNENLYDFIRKADEALYEGKKAKEIIVIHTKKI